MAYTIVPGYDFSTEEVPTYNKFKLAAERLQISGLDFADLTTTIRLILNGQESGGSGASLAEEAWMWFDPSGDLFIRQRWTSKDFGMTGHSEAYSITPVCRTYGGWASSRMVFEGGANNQAGYPIYSDALAAPDQFTPAALYYITDWTIYHDDSAPFLGYNPDTLASGVRAYFVGRGGVRQWIGTFPSAETIPHRVISFNGTQYASCDLNNVGSLKYKRWSGIFYGAHPTASFGGPSNSNFPMKWAYSKAVHGHYSAL